MRDDQRLQEEFDHLRAEQARTGSPSFDEMIARARADAEEQPRLAVVDGDAPIHAGDATHAGVTPKVRRLVAGGWAAAAAAAVAGLLLWPGGQSDADAEFERLVGAYSTQLSGWQSPTASLLDVPGMELTRSVPRLGSSGPRAGTDDGTPPSGRDS